MKVSPRKLRCWWVSLSPMFVLQRAKAERSRQERTRQGRWRTKFTPHLVRNMEFERCLLRLMIQSVPVTDSVLLFDLGEQSVDWVESR